MVERFNPAPLDKHPEDPKEAAKADREMDGNFMAWFGWHISGVRPCQRHTARDANRLAKSIVDSLMGQNPDRAPTRQKSREGPIVASSGRGEVNRPAVHAGRFISAVLQPNRFAKVRDLGVTVYRRASMCDYSLRAVATRPAEVAETLVSTKFHSTMSRGFASPDNPQVAVCLRPGTEIAFETAAQTDGMMFRKNVGDRLARFRQIDTEKSHQHHDALEFSNGTIVLVTDLVPGQRATVLQLPASPIEERPQAPQPAARYETANA